MDLHIGPLVYSVYLWSGYIPHEGQPCLGLCDHDRQCVLISDHAKNERRLQVLCHEAWHIWRHHFGSQCSTAEGEADLVGMMFVQLMKDLHGQTATELSTLTYASGDELQGGDDIAAKPA
jgi:hypothetical protein